MNTRVLVWGWIGWMGLASLAGAQFEAGDRLRLTLRGVPASEQEKVNGEFRVGESGRVKIPVLDEMVQAAGLTPEQFARRVESAFREGRIYQTPAVEIEPLAGALVEAAAPVVRVDGQVKRAGPVAFVKGMSVRQAVAAAGGRNEFGGRNLHLFRGSRVYCLDLRQLAHQNIRLEPGDTLQLDQRGIIDRWKGSEAALAPLRRGGGE